jgi:hypothetical protein
VAKPDMTDFSDFMRVNENGRIWWRLEDACMLSAGFIPKKDDEQSLTPRLVAPDNRAKANAASLFDAIVKQRGDIDTPLIAARSDGDFVPARDFLEWLGHYLLKSDSSMRFPADLARKVDAAELLHSGKKIYQNWHARLVDFYHSPFSNLPSKISAALKKDMFPFDWDTLAPEQRSHWAKNWDLKHDPAREGENRFLFEHYIRKGELEEQIVDWESKPKKTVTEPSTKESRLTTLRDELIAIIKAERRVKAVISEDAPGSERAALHPSAPTKEYVAYPIAMRTLADKFHAKPHELAMWVFWGGGESGGINAYAKANELEPPQRFVFPSPFTDFKMFFWDFNYLSLLMGTWYEVAELEVFKPLDRYITSQGLIDRWSQYPDIVVDVGAFIAAKISESRLLDAHPIARKTQWSDPESNLHPEKKQRFSRSLKLRRSKSKME